MPFGVRESIGNELFAGLFGDAIVQAKTPCLKQMYDHPSEEVFRLWDS